MIKSKYFLIAILLFFAGFSACGDDDSTSADRFEVISNTALPDGICYYAVTVNKNTTYHAFSVTEYMEGSTTWYHYTQNLSSPSYVSITVEGDPSITSKSQTISVDIYSDNEIVNSETYTSSAEEVYDSSTGTYSYVYTPPSGSLTYTFSSTSSSSSSSSSSSGS